MCICEACLYVKTMYVKTVYDGPSINEDSLYVKCVSLCEDSVYIRRECLLIVMEIWFMGL